MHPAKTELARSALAARDPALGPAERRLLILCDGKRPLDELTALLGPDTPGMLERLQERGFLTRPPIAEPPPEPLPETPAATIAPEPAALPRSGSSVIRTGRTRRGSGACSEWTIRDRTGVFGSLSWWR